jgi:phosphate transport system protein
VIRDEALINQLEIRIDDLATRLVALNQPVATDMRLIVAALKINTDLERMGDLAVSTVQRALPLIGLPRIEPAVPIADMALKVEGMVEKSISAFVGRDAELAREVLAADDEVDQMRNVIYDELTGRMEADGSVVRRALAYLFVARNLERIADHSTNIAEDVIFVVRGIDVRHRRETP